MELDYKTGFAKSLPESFGEMGALQKLDLSWRGALESLPVPFGKAGAFGGWGCPRRWRLLGHGPDQSRQVSCVHLQAVGQIRRDERAGGELYAARGALEGHAR